MSVAAPIAAVLMGVYAVFHTALAFGAPARFAAWGGWHEDKVPARLRVASAAVGLILCPAFMVLTLVSAGVIEASWVPRAGALGMWVVVGVFTAGGVASLASSSRRERIWGVVLLVVAVCSSVVALTM